MIDQEIIHNGRPPQPWEIEYHPLKLFEPEKVLIEVPNTAKIEVKLKEKINLKNKNFDYFKILVVQSML